MNDSEKIRQLHEKAMLLPCQPGVYIMKDKGKNIIYIGKSAALRNRVSQYFQRIDSHAEKVRHMVLNVDTFDYVLTDTEFEALVLECSLIKQYSPKYNILLKDDKGYQYIRISGDPFPKIDAAKRMDRDDGAEYVGPYISSFAVKQMVDITRKIYKLHWCNKKFPAEFRKQRPCLYFHIGQCCGLCRGTISQAEYGAMVKDALRFIRRGEDGTMRELEQAMNEAAENLEFEKAAMFRDRMTAIRRITEKQKIVSSRVEEQDVIALAQGAGTVCFEVFLFRSGRLTDRENFFFDQVFDLPQTRAEFLQSYYSAREYIPPIVALDGEAADQELIERFLSEKKGKKVSLHLPQRGEQKALVDMVAKNAQERISHDQQKRVREHSALEELRDLLGLEKTPEYIESYDISNTAGDSNVGAMVVFENGRPLKRAYKKFTIRTVLGQDDYGSMREMLERRFERYEQEKDKGEGFGRLPDLILLDGGKGHVGVVEPLLRSMGVHVPVFGMVKDDKHRTRAITAAGGEISILSYRSAFIFLSKVQDEVHRFAITFHQTKRKNSTLNSTLTAIPGIGEARAKALLKHFKSLSAIRSASLEELCAAEGVSRSAAEAVKEYFSKSQA